MRPGEKWNVLFLFLYSCQIFWYMFVCPQLSTSSGYICSFNQVHQAPCWMCQDLMCWYRRNWVSIAWMVPVSINEDIVEKHSLLSWCLGSMINIWLVFVGVLLNIHSAEIIRHIIIVIYCFNATNTVCLVLTSAMSCCRKIWVIFLHSVFKLRHSWNAFCKTINKQSGYIFKHLYFMSIS